VSAEQRAAVIARGAALAQHAHITTMGRVLGAGVDCATLLCEVYEAAGVVPHVDPGSYPHDWHMHRDEERYLGWLSQVRARGRRGAPGDVIVWKFGRCFSHAAILCDNDQIIHSYIGQGVRYERRFAEMFRAANGEWRAVKYFSMWDDE
jgi:cell wall-associated NlpC family hydrolase